MGVKERRTKILLSLFLLSDVDFKPVKADANVQRIFDYSANQKTKTTITSLVNEGLIQNLSAGSEEIYALNDKGFNALSLEFPFFRFLKTKWDLKWRIISYEIPEAKRELRDRLRREMQGWGLGPWHRSFWLTPHPIIENLKELVSGKAEEQYIQAFESDHAFGEREVLIEKVWGKSALDKQYRALFKKWHEILSKDGDKIDKLQKVVNEYVGMLRLDPGLPSDLMGQSWIGYEAMNIFKEIRGILLS